MCVDKTKAVFFIQFGFSMAQWEQLGIALKSHAMEHDVVKVENNDFGTRYVVEGQLKTSDERNPFVRVVWFVDVDETVPRLVTAYPLEDNHD